MDRETVIKGWETVLSRDPLDAPWDLIDETLAMLKEQEARGECLKRKCVICPHCENCDVDENGLLKEHEPVEPKYNAHTNWYECGACHYSMTSGMHCRSMLIPAYKVGFCAKCGRKQKWE